MHSEILFSDEPKNCIVPLNIETDREVFFDLSEGSITSYMDVKMIDTMKWHAESCSTIHVRKEQNENS